MTARKLVHSYQRLLGDYSHDTLKWRATALREDGYIQICTSSLRLSWQRWHYAIPQQWHRYLAYAICKTPHTRILSFQHQRHDNLKSHTVIPNFHQQLIMICARICGKSIFGVRTRNVQELKMVTRCRTAFFGSTTRHVMTSEGLFAFFGCSSISGKDERSCGCKEEDKQKEK